MSIAELFVIFLYLSCSYFSSLDCFVASVIFSAVQIVVFHIESNSGLIIMVFLRHGVILKRNKKISK